MVTIIDYGMGNLRSVQKIFERLNVNAMITDKHSEIQKAKKLLLPGVGHFGNGMKKLKEKGFVELLSEKVVNDNTPIMGICLGMQLMTNHSEESDENGLGWIDATTKKFSFEKGQLKIPHMGWNTLLTSKESLLGNGIIPDDLFYFVHSYYVSCNDTEDILFKSEYGNQFVSGFQKNHIIGVQFHPEKSHRSGLKLIQNFIDYK